MATMIDLGPVTREVSNVLAGITDAQLARPTPCERYSLGDLLDHLSGLAVAFTDAAAKQVDPDAQQASGDSSRLADDWQRTIPARLEALAQAWREPSAWEGMTQAGGIDMPGDVAGKVTLNELVVHGWDIARAGGQRFDPDPAAVEACIEHMAGRPEEVEGFGRLVHVPPDAAPLDRLIGLNGRDPAWTAPSA